MNVASDADFAARVIAWQRRHGRHDLPWQRGRDAYRVWLSEIMLQQTQVQTVVPYFERFTARFPGVSDLAAADEDEVLHLWSGLGYYSRARNLHRTARIVVAEHGGEFPRTQDALAALPGIGRSTAAAILALAHDQPAAILDGNVKRVLARYHAEPGWPGESTVLKALWAHAERLLPQREVRTYTQGLMDLGATVCTRSRPLCAACPLAGDCAAHAAGTVGEYPAPRPRRTLPERRTRFLVLRDGQGRVLLEKRPASGVWGGLWCFPELAEGKAIDDAVRALGHAPRGAPATLAPLTHGFTHFRLTIDPVVVEVDNSTLEVRENEGLRWYSAGDSTRIGLSAPVAKLLAALAIPSAD
ncbi:MAG: A/G-specific adenine glycosylase [Gammaproteobacteria bacterium]|nr:A/G-specific adenine glycosylase [Gammaproteobacteria bacterium]MCP5199662.1 A/G-specific adenine glycosylase [Gammaproteobacteria bacterium]